MVLFLNKIVTTRSRNSLLTTFIKINIIKKYFEQTLNIDFIKHIDYAIISSKRACVFLRLVQNNFHIERKSSKTTANSVTKKPIKRRPPISYSNG